MSRRTTSYSMEKLRKQRATDLNALAWRSKLNAHGTHGRFTSTAFTTNRESAVRIAMRRKSRKKVTLPKIGGDA